MPWRSLNGRESTVETTNPINGNDIEAVVEHLIAETPTNSEETTEETVEATDDGQTEAVDDVVETEDDIEAQSDDLVDQDESLGEEYEEAEESEVQEDTTFTVKVNGSERNVTLDELKRGYSGQKYIQEGMAEVSTTRKEMEQLQQVLSQERQMLQQMVQTYQTGGVPQVPEYPSEELRDSDPIGYTMATEEYRRSLEKRQAFEQQMQYVAQQDWKQKQAENERFIEQQGLRLAEWMPEFADPEKKATIVKDMTVKAKKHYGLSDEQISTVKTAEEVMILRDALRFRELKANKANVTKKAEGARPVVKPTAKRAESSGKASRAKKATASMQRTGSNADVANWLLS